MVIVDYQPNMTAESSAISPHACLDITVVIPTYNGAERIPQVLDGLKQQIDIDGLLWEVIICDNNSCDRTANVTREYQQAWVDYVCLRYCFVAEQGAAFARQRGVEEARGQIVAFLDDDNIPAPDWLCNVHQFAGKHPRAGAFGSQIHGDFQGELPEGFGDIACFLAIVERGNKPHLYEPKTKILPPAAGVAVRREAWLTSVPDRLFLNHKGKSAGLASEDLEAMLHIQKAGWEIWYNSDMVVTHQIPKGRLQQEYLVSLLRCIGLSRFYIRWLGIQDWQRFFKVPAYVANDLRKLAFHYLKNGTQKTSLDTVTACERALLTSTVASPVFLLRKAFQDFWQKRLDHTRLPERQLWLQQLTDAFESNQLELYQQEIVSINSQLYVESDGSGSKQFEILLRLRQGSSDELPASPEVFFPTAERYGLMRALDRRIIQQVFEIVQKQQFDAEYSINLSAASIEDPSFQSFLVGQLRCGQLQPHKICFEISEFALQQAFLTAKVLITWMRKQGLKVFIDEVTQPVALADYMTQVSIDGVKLSKSISLLDKDADSLISEWLKLSQKRDFQLIAKGIETQKLLGRVKTFGVPYVQGYAVSTLCPLGTVQL